MARQWRALTEPFLRETPDRSQAPEGPSVIVYGSADGGAGAAANWLPTWLPQSRHVIATTGYTPPRSVMGHLALLADLPLQEGRRHPGHIAWPAGKLFPIRQVQATVTRLRGYSAHADQADLLDWVFLRCEHGDGVVAPTLFLQHGNDREREALRDEILQRAAASGQSISVRLTQQGEGCVDLDAHD